MLNRWRESGLRSWIVRHQSTIREWLLLVAAVIAGYVGLQQISDERSARHSTEAEAQRVELRAQANEVSAWLTPRDGATEIGDTGMNVILSNQSHQPVYQAVISRVVAIGAGIRFGREIPRELSLEDQREVLVIPPGEYKIQFPGGFYGMGAQPGFEIAFQDQAGKYWARSGTGVLKQISKPPLSYYNISLPPSWALTEKIG